MRAFLVVLLLVALVNAQNRYNYWATCTGDQEQPPVSSPHFGLVVVRCTDTGAGDTVLNYTVVHTIPNDNVTAMHFHAKADGQVVQSIPKGSIRGTTGDWVLRASTHPNVTTAADLYVNIHTTQYGGGELRCNLLVANSTISSATVMTGSQESTPNNSPHLGIGIINIVNSSFAEYFAAWTPDDANAAHIHGFAEPGVDAGVLVNLGISENDTFAIGDFNTSDILTNSTEFTYFNVHTDNFGAGEIRGQNFDVQLPCPVYIGPPTTGGPASSTGGPASSTGSPTSTTGGPASTTNGPAGPGASSQSTSTTTTAGGTVAGPTGGGRSTTTTRVTSAGQTSSTTQADEASSLQMAFLLLCLLLVAAMCL